MLINGVKTKAVNVKKYKIYIFGFDSVKFKKDLVKDKSMYYTYDIELGLLNKGGLLCYL